MNNTKVDLVWYNLDLGVYPEDLSKPYLYMFQDGSFEYKTIELPFSHTFTVEAYFKLLGIVAWGKIEVNDQAPEDPRPISHGQFKGMPDFCILYVEDLTRSPGVFGHIFPVTKVTVKSSIMLIDTNSFSYSLDDGEWAYDKTTGMEVRRVWPKFPDKATRERVKWRDISHPEPFLLSPRQAGSRYVAKSTRSDRLGR